VLNPDDQPRITVATIVFIGLVAGFAVAQLSGSRPAGGVVLILSGLAAATVMWRAGGRWGIVAAGLAYAAAFALSHPLATITTAWPASIISALVAAAVAYAVTPAKAGTSAGLSER
jgi:hypothetical protein